MYAHAMLSGSSQVSLACPSDSAVRSMESKAFFKSRKTLAVGKRGVWRVSSNWRRIKIWWMRSRPGRSPTCYSWTLLTRIGVRRRSIIEAEILVTIRTKMIPRLLLLSLRVSVAKMCTIGDALHVNRLHSSFQIHVLMRQTLLLKPLHPD